MNLQIHALQPTTSANGPGVRATVWVQGCTIGCPGCFNPGTHNPSGGFNADTAALAEQLANLHGIEGVSISGGEPLQQPDALADLLERLRPSPLSILVFSGYTLQAIRNLPFGPKVLSLIDVLVAGPYQASSHSGVGLLGSANQRIHLLTNRYKLDDFGRIPGGEVILHRDGTMTLTGITPLRKISGSSVT